MKAIKCRGVVSYEVLFKVPIPDDMEPYNGIDDLLMRAEEEVCETLPDEIGDYGLVWHINWDTLRFYEEKRGGN